MRRTQKPLDGTNLVGQIPPPQVVRDRLGDALREAKLLRHLLRIAERAEQERKNLKGVSDDQ